MRDQEVTQNAGPSGHTKCWTKWSMEVQIQKFVEQTKYFWFDNDSSNYLSIYQNLSYHIWFATSATYSTDERQIIRSLSSSQCICKIIFLFFSFHSYFSSFIVHLCLWKSFWLFVLLVLWFWMFCWWCLFLIRLSVPCGLTKSQSYSFLIISEHKVGKCRWWERSLAAPTSGGSTPPESFKTFTRTR